ncbi:hypothetical protein EON64_14965 [archaeon]|nr:MAG: hypothetical protein EON64_14965 [archaeon]
MVMKVNEAVGKLGEEDGRALNVYQFRMHRGSFWGEDGLVRKAGGRPPPVSGYFELHNKSSEVMALKLVKDTGSPLFEAARPSYISVPPGDTVYTFFGPDIQALHLIVLFGNPHPLPSDRAILYDTRAHGANPLRLSPCARIFEHPSCLVYRSACQGRNVVLKYKGLGEVLARRGNGVGRVGLLGWAAGRRFAPDLPDLNSNVAAVVLETRIEAQTPSQKAERRNS